MLDHEHIKSHYRPIAVNLSGQKELDADPKAIQKFVRQLKSPDNAILDNESMFVLTILEKIQRNEIKIFSRKRNSLIKDGNL